MKENKVKEDIRVFYNLMNEITPASSWISHHFLFQGRCIIGYYPQKGRRGAISYIEDPDVLENLTMHICQKLWAKATERVGVFEHLKNLLIFDDYQKSLISEAIKNARIQRAFLKSENFEKIRENVLGGKGMIFYLTKKEADKIVCPFENALKVPVSYDLMHKLMPDIANLISSDIKEGINNLMKLVFEEKI